MGKKTPKKVTLLEKLHFFFPPKMTTLHFEILSVSYFYSLCPFVLSCKSKKRKIAGGIFNGKKWHKNYSNRNIRISLHEYNYSLTFVVVVVLWHSSRSLTCPPALSWASMTVSLPAPTMLFFLRPRLDGAGITTTWGVPSSFLSLEDWNKMVFYRSNSQNKYEHIYIYIYIEFYFLNQLERDV